MPDNNSIWLEVESVRTENNSDLSIKIKGDRTDPRWWPVKNAAAGFGFDSIMNALNGEHIVLAQLSSAGADLAVTKLRIERKEAYAR